MKSVLKYKPGKGDPIKKYMKKLKKANSENKPLKYKIVEIFITAVVKD